jgi:hypothetical protein
MTAMNELLATLAAKAHEHQLVPFLGAGCSLGHVKVDWDGISHVMSARLPPSPSKSNAEISEDFVVAHGHGALCDLLGEHLLIRAFHDEHGTIPLQVLALELRSAYTTNQDNVLEVAAAHYGRPIVVVSTLEDLRKVRPGDRILYKFHGSLEHPETVVFTESQYQARMAAPDHFMDIRLRSDLLTKSLLFVGYSFRDPNLRALIKELAARFPGSLPGSYLIAYRWSDDLRMLCEEYGVECVDPAAHITSPSDDLDSNLEMFLRELCEKTFSLSTSDELEEMFRPKKPVPARIAIRCEVEAMASLASSGAESSLAVFRGTCDRTSIPESLRTVVSEALVQIIRRSRPEHHGQLQGTLLNLNLPIIAMLAPAGAYLAYANRLPEAALSVHMPPGNSWPQPLLPVAAAVAVQFLRLWNEPISDNFYSRSSQWFDRFWPQLPEPLKAYVRPWIAAAWGQRHTIYEQPIARAERIAALNKHPLVVPKSYGEIFSDLMAALPKQFPTPRE